MCSIRAPWRSNNTEPRHVYAQPPRANANNTVTRQGGFSQFQADQHIIVLFGEFAIRPDADHVGAFPEFAHEPGTILGIDQWGILGAEM